VGENVHSLEARRSVGFEVLRLPRHETLKNSGVSHTAGIGGVLIGEIVLHGLRRGIERIAPAGPHDRHYAHPILLAGIEELLQSERPLKDFVFGEIGETVRENKDFLRFAVVAQLLQKRFAAEFGVVPFRIAAAIEDRLQGVVVVEIELDYASGNRGVALFEDAIGDEEHDLENSERTGYDSP
jgi:hypothetical protein